MASPIDELLPGWGSAPRRRNAGLTHVLARPGHIDPRPLRYRGIRMRSTLETDFARHLDEIGERWRYEPRIYGPAGSGYLPDFQILRDGPACYIEVKPTLQEVPLARERMEVIWETEPDALLMVACAAGCTFSAAVKGGPWESFIERWKHA